MTNDAPNPNVSNIIRYAGPGHEQLEVHMAADASYPVVGLLAPGARVVGVPDGEWLQLTRGPLLGAWVPAAHLTDEEPATRPATPYLHVTGRVMSDDRWANIRSGPGFEHDVVARYEHHQEVSGSAVGDGPWLATALGFVNTGTLCVYAADPTTCNGRIPEHLLAPIPLEYNATGDFDPGYTATTTRYLNPAALTALQDWQRAFEARFGHLATIDLTYRPYDEQRYWFDKFGSPRAAIPGTSNHGYGLSIDFEERAEPWLYSWGTERNDWLLEHESEFGFNNPFAATLQEGEDYHFNFVG